MSDDPAKSTTELASFLHPKWAAVFFVLGGAILLVVGILVVLLTGYSAASDRVFAIEALAAGMGAIFAIQFFFNRKLVVAENLPLPLYYIWPALCLYVFLLRPFE